jgi:hypothetical protein
MYKFQAVSQQLRDGHGGFTPHFRTALGSILKEFSFIRHNGFPVECPGSESIHRSFYFIFAASWQINTQRLQDISLRTLPKFPIPNFLSAVL